MMKYILFLIALVFLPHPLFAQVWPENREIAPGTSPSMNLNGRFIAFQSRARLAAGDHNDWWDIYIHDRDKDQDGTFDEEGATETILISGRRVGSFFTGNGSSPQINADGRFVVYYSEETDSGRGRQWQPRTVVFDRDSDRDGIFDEFDEENGTSLAFVPLPENHEMPHIESDYPESSFPHIDADGRFVAFSAKEIGSQNHAVFVHDRDTSQLIQISEHIHINCINCGLAQFLSPDGRYVYFYEFFAPRQGGQRRVWSVLERNWRLHDRDVDQDGVFDEEGATGTERMGSPSRHETFDSRYLRDFIFPMDQAGNWHPRVSANERFVVTVHPAYPLPSGVVDVNLRFFDRVTTNQSERIGGAGYDAVISKDGRYTAFSRWIYASIWDWRIYVTANPVPTHLECSGRMCMPVAGEGENTCQNHQECLPPTHLSCQQNACVPVAGAGPDECQTNRDCLSLHSFACVENGDAGSDASRPGAIEQYRDQNPPVVWKDACKAETYLQEFFCNDATGQHEFQWYRCKWCQTNAEGIGFCDPQYGDITLIDWPP